MELAGPGGGAGPPPGGMLQACFSGFWARACFALGRLAALGLGPWVRRAIGGGQGRPVGNSNRALGEVGMSVMLMVWVVGSLLTPLCHQPASRSAPVLPS